VDPAARRAFALSSTRPTTPFSRPRRRSQTEHAKRPRGPAGTAGWAAAVGEEARFALLLLFAFSSLRL